MKRLISVLDDTKPTERRTLLVKTALAFACGFFLSYIVGAIVSHATVKVGLLGESSDV